VENRAVDRVRNPFLGRITITDRTRK